MAKHLRATFPTKCFFCKTPVNKGDMVVKIKDISDSKRRRWFLARIAPYTENWVHKRCYRAGLDIYKAELEQKQAAAQSNNIPAPSARYQVVLTNADFQNFNAKVDSINAFRIRHHALYGTYPSLTLTGEMFKTSGSVLFTDLETDDARSTVTALASRGAKVEMRPLPN